MRATQALRHLTRMKNSSSRLSRAVVCCILIGGCEGSTLANPPWGSLKEPPALLPSELVAHAEAKAVAVGRAHNLGLDRMLAKLEALPEGQSVPNLFAAVRTELRQLSAEELPGRSARPITTALKTQYVRGFLGGSSSGIPYLDVERAFEERLSPSMKGAIFRLTNSLNALSAVAPESAWADSIGAIRASALSDQSLTVTERRMLLVAAAVADSSMAYWRTNGDRWERVINARLRQSAEFDSISYRQLRASLGEGIKLIQRPQGALSALAFSKAARDACDEEDWESCCGENENFSLREPTPRAGGARTEEAACIFWIPIIAADVAGAGWGVIEAFFLDGCLDLPTQEEQLDCLYESMLWSALEASLTTGIGLKVLKWLRRYL